MFPPGSTSFEQTVTSINRRYDAIVDGAMTIEGRPVKRFFEFKSYKSVPPDNFAEQFIKDLNNPDIVDLKQLKWLFDAAKNPANFEANMKAAIDGLPLTNDLAKKFVKDIQNPTANDLKVFLKDEFFEIFKLD